MLSKGFICCVSLDIYIHPYIHLQDFLKSRWTRRQDPCKCGIGSAATHGHGAHSSTGELTASPTHRQRWMWTGNLLSKGAFYHLLTPTTSVSVKHVQHIKKKHKTKVVYFIQNTFNFLDAHSESWEMSAVNWTTHKHNGFYFDEAIKFKK